MDERAVPGKPGSPTPPGPDEPAIRCPVCGDSIQRGNRVDCARCETPHHRDCFEYSGQCAVYACGSRRYALTWHPQPRPRRGELVKVGRPAALPAPSGQTVVARRNRTQVALGEGEIRIEATGPTRALGFWFLGSSGAVASAMGCSALESAGGCSGCDVLASGEGLVVVLALFGVVLAAWLIGRFVVPAILYALGQLLYWCDSSYWTVDESSRRLILRGKLFGIPFWKRSWSAKKVDRVIAGPVRGGTTRFLVVRFQGGRQLWVADDRSHARMGYSTGDLKRMGKRLAEELAVPFNAVGDVPELPAEPAEPGA